MSRLRQSLRLARSAARANLLPGVLLVYFMPPLLQIPVAVFIQTFWVLLLTTMEESLRRHSLR